MLQIVVAVLNSEQNHELSVATDDHQGDEAGKQNNL
jgi:hypothetical protein